MRPHASVVSASFAHAEAAKRGLSIEEFMLDLLPASLALAIPPISNFRVGAVALGSSGALYAGANLEFPGESLSFTVHAEQAAVYNAWVHGETGVTLIASTAAPCGYCRQFLNELTTASELRVMLPGRPPAPLADLLPAAFGPRDLGLPGGLMQPATVSLKLAEPSADPLTNAALAAARAAYAPYSCTYAGVGLRTSDGAVYEGRYAENAAFNPSLAPLQGALIALALAGGSYASIEAAVLVEVCEPASGHLQHSASQRASAAAVLAAVAPNVPLVFVRAVRAGDERHDAGV